MNLRGKALSLLLSAAMILNMGINPVFALAANESVTIGASSLCEHHSEHTKECGYTEGTVETPCTHEHTVDCYTDEPICGLTEEVLDSASGSNAAHTHTQECYKLDCAHVHDETCGYAKETVGTPCTFKCEVCNAANDKPLDSGTVSTPSNAAKAVTNWQFVDPDKNLTDNTLALPGVNAQAQASLEDIIAMLPTTLTGTVEGEAEPVTVNITDWACESYKQDESGNWPISGTYTFVATLSEGYLATPTPTVAVELGGANVLVAGETGNFTVTGGTYGTSHKYENNMLTILDSTALTISGTTTTDKIVVQGGVTANITLDGVNIQFNDGNWQKAGTCAFDIKGTATANITLTGENTLQSGYGKAGLQTPTGATVTIYGTGTLNVTGGLGGAGIGGGESSGASGAIEITSGTVVARGTGNSAGIGGGWNTAGGTVKINGGTVTATGGGDGAGVGGGGNNGAGGAVTISGGMVTATGSGTGWGIGSGGSAGSAGTFSTDTSGNALIVTNNIHDQGNKASWSGVIFEGNTGLIYGTPTLSNDAEIPSGKQLTVANAKTLAIGSGVTLTNRGTIFVYGTINGSGNINNSGGIYTTGTGAVSGVAVSGNPVTAVNYVTQNGLVVYEGVHGQDYTYANNTLTILKDTQLTISGTTTADKIVVQSGITANITLAGVDIQFNDGEWGNAGTCAFDMTGATVNLTLKDATNNILRSGNLLPGVKIPAESTLVVDGTGALTAIGGSVGAGIGGDGTEGNLIIKGGKLSAQGTGHNGGFGVMGITTSIVQVQGGELEAIGGVNAWTGNANGIGGKLQCNNNSGTAIVITTGIADITNMAEWSGIVFNGTAGFVHGSQTLPRDFEVESGKTLTIGSGATLTVPTGKTLTNAGIITVAQGGKLTNNGTVTNNGTIINNGTIDGTAISGTAPMEKSATAVTFAIKGTPNTPVTAAEYGQTIVVTATAQKDTTGRNRSAAVDKVDFYLGDTATGTKLGTGNVTNNGGICTATLEVALTDAKWTPSGTPYTITADFGGVTGLQASTGTGTLTVNKGSRTIPAPTLASKTGTTVTLNAVTPSVGSSDGTVEYGYATTDNSTGISNWQTGLTLSGLTGGTTYYFFARVTGGTNYADTTSTPGTAVETAPAEQFSLTPGGVYYFDLSGADVKGTVNTAIPDTTLHYVPFTYAGTVNAYSLDSTSNGNAGASAAATSNIHSLFLADYNVSNNISWDTLNTASLIFGKSYTSGGVGYTLRAPSAGSNSGSNGGTPTTNEWDSIYTKNNGYIKNFTSIRSWGQDTYADDTSSRTLRGYSSAVGWNCNLASTYNTGDSFRPVLEVLDASTLTADGLQEVTLNLNGGLLGYSNADIKIIVKKDTAYSAPSGAELKRPSGNATTDFYWSTTADGNGDNYAAGESVPATVKTLYAQWENPPEQFNLTPGGVYYFDLSGADVKGAVNNDIPDTTLHYVPFTYAGTVNAYSLDSTSNGNAGASAAATSNIHSLFLADYNVSNNISWDTLNTASLIFGKSYTSGGVVYSLRAPSAGSATANYPFSDQGGTPTTNEWDSIYAKSNGYIKNFSEVYSLGQDTSTLSAESRASRGKSAATFWNSSRAANIGHTVGWRPILEVPKNLTADDLQEVTLNLNGGTLGTSTSNIEIIVKNNTAYTAPSGTGLTAPTKKQFTGWNTAQNGGGTSYAAGASVPATVTTLYAQWKATAYSVTLTVNKDDTAWADHGKTFQLTSNGGITFITDLTNVANGTYQIYDGSTDTDVTVTVTDANAAATVDYYSVTFYDGTTAYSSGTPQAPQIVLKNTVATKPSADPAKTGNTFTKWVTANGGSVEFVFTTNITAATKAYASWTPQIVFVTVTGVTLDKSTLALYSNTTPNTATLTATVAPANATNKVLTWQSSNTAVASVTNGTVRSVGNGTATITATTADGNFTASCTVTVSAYSSGGGGGSTDDDRDDNDSTITKPSDPTPPTTGTIETPVKPDKDGNAKVDIPDDKIKDTITKAEKDGGASSISVTVDVTGKGITGNLQITLSPETLDRLIRANVKEFTIQNGFCTLRFNLEALKKLKSDAIDSPILITVGKQNVSKLSKEAQTAIGSRPALSITATYQKDGKTQNITSLGKGRLSVGIPYTKTAAEQSGGLYGVYVDGAGKVTYITGSSYDENSKTLLFGTDHLSIYGVGYKTAPQFTDINKHWAKADIEFVAGRGLLTGTSADKFSPDSSMTRGMFVTALGRLAEIDANSYKNGHFTDVKADAYYAPYVNWAAKNNVVSGTTATTFAPDQPISRQEMAQMIANYAKAIGFNLPKAHQENIFADSAKIEEWAKASVKEMQMAGIITGKNGNKFDPTGTATRAEVSAVLRRFVELALDSGTAQGWTQNDSGKWMYYKDGVKLTGKQTIGGVSYDFNGSGETTRVPDWNFTTHTVVRGDSFWSIARKYKVNMFTLASVNGKSIFNIIKPGDVLKIPQK